MFSLFRHGVGPNLPQTTTVSSLLRSNAIARSCCLWQRARTLSTRPSTSLKPTHSIYVSNSTNPYFNLTFEDWLFRYHPPDTPLLLLYRDAPCVVIGRNQNPWKEVNLAASETRGIPWIRRRSGGGTVYHDLGNTNYSIHVPRASFDRTATARIVVRAVRALGVDAYVNERNDICVSGEKMSGSAYKIANNRAYHHGTMLISTQLDTLSDLLHTNKESMRTKGVASVRSPVQNLVHSSPLATHGSFFNAVVQSFREEYTIDQEPHFVHESSLYLEDEYFKVGMSELRSWEWAYGQTPEFEYVITETFRWGQLTSTIHARHGLILSCSFSFSPTARVPTKIRSWLDRISQQLVGKRYGFVEDSEVNDDDGETKDTGEIWSWLRGEVCLN